MVTVSKEGRQTSVNALAVLSQEDHRGKLEMLLAKETTPFVRVYLVLLREGSLSRKELRKRLPDLSHATIDRATRNLIGQYFVKSRRIARETLYWPRPLLDQPRRETPRTQGRIETVERSSWDSLRFRRATKESKLRLIAILEKQRPLLVFQVGRGKPNACITCNFSDLGNMPEPLRKQTKLLTALLW